jgi:hypothetical protein
VNPSSRVMVGLLPGARDTVAMVVAVWEGAQGNRGCGRRHPYRQGSPDPRGCDACSHSSWSWRCDGGAVEMRWEQLAVKKEKVRSRMGNGVRSSDASDVRLEALSIRAAGGSWRAPRIRPYLALKKREGEISRGKS